VVIKPRQLGRKAQCLPTLAKHMPYTDKKSISNLNWHISKALNIYRAYEDVPTYMALKTLVIIKDYIDREGIQCSSGLSIYGPHQTHNRVSFVGNHKAVHFFFCRERVVVDRRWRDSVFSMWELYNLYQYTSKYHALDNSLVIDHYVWASTE
jgi:hypothetical protein